MSSPSGPASVTPDPSIHNVPTGASKSPSDLLKQFEQMGPALVEEVLASVLLAVSGISIFGIKPFAGLAVWANALQAMASQALTTANGAQSTADGAQTQGQNIIDGILGGLGSTTSTGNPVELLAPAFGAAMTAITTAEAAATNAYTAVTQFGSIVAQLVSEVEAPIFADVNDFLQQIERVAGILVGNVNTSLSPNNPPVQQNTAQIAAILAHLSGSSSAGINYTFSPSVLLSANFMATSNPSFTAPTGLTLPTVGAGTDYIQTSTFTAGVFTGNPNASVTDHSVVTDRHHVQATIRNLYPGHAQIFLCGNGTTGLGAHVALDISHQSFGDALSIMTYTDAGRLSGTARQVAYSNQGANGMKALAVNDTVIIEYDDAGNFTMYLNGVEVGIWPDSGGIVSHGPGFREIGAKSNMDDYSLGLGPGLGSFVAYDY